MTIHLARVLIADGDRAFASSVGEKLIDAGFDVGTAVDGGAILDRLSQDAADVLIVERKLRDGSGVAVLRQIKADRATRALPIIMTASDADHVDLCRALDNGADDFVHKPVMPVEIVARVRALLRRAQPRLGGERLEHADIVVEMDTFRAFRGTTALRLGPTEFNILATFVAKPNRVWTREQLLASVWGPNTIIEIRTVDVHVGRLRKALREAGEGDPFRTIRGIGYALD